MLYEQTVEIPQNRKLEIALPESVPAGMARFCLVAGVPETMLLSESSLAHEWLDAEEEKTWAHL
ncbi:MAG: hypothetical protein LBG72_05025 [Spirochaetaceae bacterium]|nr:hypothetical protein [Spirochaetaceae bacterium]